MKRKPKHIGLVLSGGGTRGIAHIGVIKAMREFGLEAEFVSGTSAGAIVGALYAANKSVEEMLEVFRNVSLFSYRNYSILKPGLLDSNILFKLYGSRFEFRKFEDLKRKLYVSVTNLVTGQNEIWHEGSLLDAVVASSAFPGIFSPVYLHGDLYGDGGITNNFPIEPLQWKCDLIVGSYVNPLKTIEKSDLKNTLSILDRVFHINMYKMEAPDFNRADIFVMPQKLSHYKTFSLKNVEQIMGIGYIAGKKAIEKYLAED